jgi:hypothetical protein
VRREENPPDGPAFGSQAHEEIGAAGKDRQVLAVQAIGPGTVLEESGDAGFAGVGISRGKKCGIDAREGE